MRRKRYGWMASLVWLALQGCSSTDQPAPSSEISRMSSARKKIDIHEPGSLWSEDSRWNVTYSVASSRVVGESLTVTLAKNLKEKILALDPSYEKPDPKSDGKAKSKTEDRSPAAEGGAGAPKPITLDAVVTEVMPNGLLRVSVLQDVNLGDSSPHINLEATVRERDIADDNSLSSDRLINPNFAADYPPAPKKDGKTPSAGAAANAGAT